MLAAPPLPPPTTTTGYHDGDFAEDDDPTCKFVKKEFKYKYSRETPETQSPWWLQFSKTAVSGA